MASANYKIVAQVELDTSNIQDQLNKVTGKLKSSGTGQELELTFQQANLIMNKSVDIISDMVDQVYDLNSAITELRKVSSLDGGTLDDYVDKLAELGQTVGRTASEMVEAATQFRKNSFNDTDSANLAKVAATFQNVADTSISASDATSFIISQMKAFGIEAENASSIIDKVNATANNFAVGTNDLSNALEVAAAGMSTYGNSIDETIALLTSGTEIMVGRSSQVARGLMTISANIVTNKDTLQELGVQVVKSNGDFYSTYEVLNQLYPVWQKMTEVQRQELGITLAGKNQYKVLASVMTNFSDATKALAVSQNSVGSAMQENEKYMDSLEAKTNQLKAVFQDLANNVINSDLIGAILELGTGALQTLDTKVGQFITTATLLTGTLTGLFSLISQFHIASLIVSPTFQAAAAIGAVVAAAIALYNVYKELNPELSEINNSIQTDTERLEQIKNRMLEISKIPWRDRSAAIQDEYDQLVLENAQLERNLELRKQQRFETLRNQHTIQIKGATTYGSANHQGDFYTRQEAVDYWNSIYGKGAKQESEWMLNLKISQIQGISMTQAYTTAEGYNILAEALENAGGAEQKYNSIVDNNIELIQERVRGLKELEEQGEILTAEENRLIDAYEKYANSLNLVADAENNVENSVPDESRWINALDNLSWASANAKSQAYALAKQINALSAQGLNVDKQKQALWELAKQAGMTKLAFIELYGVMGGSSSSSSSGTTSYSGGGGSSSSSSTKQSKYEKIASFMQDTIGKELDAIDSQIEDINAKYDAQLEALENENEALENQLELQKKLAALAKAKDQKTLVYTANGYQYVSDIDAVSTAQENLNAYQRQQALEAAKAEIEANRAAALAPLNEQRSKLEELNELFSSLSSLVETEEGRKLAKSLLGTDIASASSASKLKNLLLSLVSGSHANGTISAPGGLSLVGEKGAELRVLNQGDGIIPSNLTKNLMQWGKINPNNSSFGTILNISNVSLPSVTNAEQFVSGLRQLAYQRAYVRA